jgi:hypothetical protein
MDTVIIICKDCESEFKVHPWELKRGIRFCSRDCYNAYRLRKNIVVDIDGQINRGMEGQNG